ncbi:MAG: adenylate/guanylate cyclase domain-containing protein [Anaerolineae bacterium]
MQSEKARRAAVSRRLTLITVAANVLGAFLSIFFFNVQVEGDVASSVIGLNVLVIGGLVILGVVIGNHLQRPLDTWYQTPVSHPPDLRVQRLALMLPLFNAGTSLGMWLLAGLINAALSLNLSGPDTFLRSAVLMFISLAGIAGPITTFLVYFASERVWRSEIPLFFPNRHPGEVNAFSLSLRQRLLVPFILTGILMLLMVGLSALAWRGAYHRSTMTDLRLLLQTLRNQELYLLGIGLLVVWGLSATLGRDLVDRISVLREAMQQVQAGDLQVHVPVTSDDELGDLAAGFNIMVEGLRQEETIRRLFGRYVTPQVAEHAIAHGAELGGQQTRATVLFTDVRGFTALTERLSAAVLIELLNRYFEALSTVILEHGGLINKFGGDSLLAVFGAPLNPLEQPADEAVQTAEEILVMLEAFNAEQRRRGEPQLRIGIGVATGPVVAGNVGSRERMEYTVIGDTVNLASRLEALTKEHPVAVLIDDETARQTTSVSLRPLGEVTVRGKETPVRVYTLDVEK